MKTKVAQGADDQPTDPSIAFDGWAAWDGTSFATPIAAAMIARTMTRTGLPRPPRPQTKLLANAPLAPQPDFPHAVLLDELEGLPGPVLAATAVDHLQVVLPSPGVSATSHWPTKESWATVAEKRWANVGSSRQKRSTPSSNEAP